MYSSHVLRALCAVALFAASAEPAIAVTPAPSPSPTALPEITRVTTSDRSGETLKNAVRTTYVVTKDDIARNGYRTVADAIAQLPGVEIQNYGTIGSAVSYGIRGSSSAEVLVLIDGMPAPGSFGNSVDLGVLPTIGVRRIEVVEGGGSTLYGSGAIGGIINIITDAQKAPPAADIRYGSLGDREFTLAADGFSISRTVADNAYNIPPATVGGVAIPVTRGNADYEATSAHYGLDRTLGAFDISLRAGITGSHLGAPGGLSFLSNTSRENDVNANTALTIAHRAAQSTSTLQLGGSRQQTTFGCDPTATNCYQTQTAVSTESRTDLSLNNVVTGNSERLIYGIDLSRGDVRSDSGSIYSVTPSGSTFSVNALAQTAAYAQETMQFGESVRAYAGLRGERDGALGGEISPSVGFTVALAPEASLKVNAATAFRAPNATELYFPGYGNPNLRAERAQVGDVTLDLPTLLGGSSIGWFTNRTNNLIVAELIDATTGTYAPENVDHAFLQGFTFDTRTRPLHHVSATMNVTDLYRAEDLNAQTRLPHDAVITVNLGLNVTGGLSGAFEDAGISVRAVGQRSPNDTTLPAFAQSTAYSTTDAFVRFRVTNRVRLTLRGYNLGNERYAEISGYPMPGRTFAVELTTR